MHDDVAPPPAPGREEVHALVGLAALFAITAAWWALALWPLDDTPLWLARTRYVCFGVADTGLPDAGGWIGLIGGPIGMLTILLAGWHRGVRRLLARFWRSRKVAAALIALALGCTALVAGAAVRVLQARTVTAWVTDDALPAHDYPRLDRTPPPLALTTQHGAVLDLATLRGRPVLVTFAYAHCQTVCPLVVMHVLKAQEMLRGSTDLPAVLIVTLDPWRDPPSRLPAIAARWRLPDTDAWVLSGSVHTVEATLDAWDVPRTRSTTTGDLTHPSLVYIIGRDGRLMFASTGGADDLVSLVRRL